VEVIFHERDTSSNDRLDGPETLSASAGAESGGR
jgi:hypothetical protein